MRTVWSSPSAATTFKDPRDGRRFRGKYNVEVVIYEEGDDITHVGGVVSAIRAISGHGNPVRADPHPDRISAAPVMIPDAVFAALPQDAHVAIEWTFQPEAEL